MVDDGFLLGQFVDERIGKFVTEAERLRFEVDAGVVTDDLTVIHEKLLKVRANMDRLEEMTAKLMALRHKSREAVTDAKALQGAKWDEEATKKNVGFQWGDAAPRERYAKYNLSTIRETMAVRDAERIDSQVEYALDVCKWFHSGLSGVRWTLDNRIRLITFDTRLER